MEINAAGIVKMIKMERRIMERRIMVRRIRIKRRNMEEGFLVGRWAAFIPLSLKQKMLKAEMEKSKLSGEGPTRETQIKGGKKGLSDFVRES